MRVFRCLQPKWNNFQTADWGVQLQQLLVSALPRHAEVVKIWRVSEAGYRFKLQDGFESVMCVRGPNIMCKVSQSLSLVMIKVRHYIHLKPKICEEVGK